MSTNIGVMKKIDFSFIKSEKFKKICFYSIFIILFLFIVDVAFALPTPPPAGGGGTQPQATGSINTITTALGTLVDDFFQKIMEQLAVMIANLSAVVLALCVLLFTIDFLLKLLQQIGNLYQLLLEIV